jgi:diaminohydroxyphosphoribosylaminopyrimidine deaminase/5-amino-6-(5-phosphoribosylamino)uracil reductase
VGVSPHLLRAYELARAHHPHPNPKVGAVVVSTEGQVLGEGSHEGAGHPHAEVVALDQVEGARGSTVYVSLEPCSHQGRTPPCTDRLIAEGVARVVIGTEDPDPQVSGSGIATLRQAGIDVEVVNDPRARDVDPAYFHHRETGMPLVTVKWAMTLDGSVAAADGSSQWITRSPTRLIGHELRSQVDAVVVGAGTLRTDDPRLDVRIDGYRGFQPRPVIVVGNGDLPEEARIWAREPIVVSTLDRGIPTGELVRVDGFDGLPDPVDVCLSLADMGVLHMLLEGGPTLAGAWWRADVVDNGFVHIGAKVGGGAGRSPMAGVFATITDADDVEFDTVRSVSDDIVIAFRKRS